MVRALCEGETGSEGCFINYCWCSLLKSASLHHCPGQQQRQYNSTIAWCLDIENYYKGLFDAVLSSSISDPRISYYFNEEFFFRWHNLVMVQAVEVYNEVELKQICTQWGVVCCLSVATGRVLVPVSGLLLCDNLLLMMQPRQLMRRALSQLWSRLPGHWQLATLKTLQLDILFYHYSSDNTIFTLYGVTCGISPCF